MPKPHRTVHDGLEFVWNEFVTAQREENDRRFHSGLAEARAFDDAAQELHGRAEQVVQALFGTTPSNRRPQVGRIDFQEVDRRREETAADVGDAAIGAAMVGYPQAVYGIWPAAAGAWIDKVRPGGEWDDKAGESDWRSYERQGNFSYGATASALGLPEEVALRGAGLAQRLENAWEAITGNRLSSSEGGLRWPYGDDPRDQPPIAAGYRYDQRRRKSGVRR